MTEDKTNNSDIWIGRAHLVAGEGESPFLSTDTIGAYTNCVSSALSASGFRKKVEVLFGREGFLVEELTDIELLTQREMDATSAADVASLARIRVLISEADLKTQIVTTNLNTYSQEDLTL